MESEVTDNNVAFGFFCFGKNAELSTTKVYKAYKDVSLFKKTIYGRPFTGNLYRIEKSYEKSWI